MKLNSVKPIKAISNIKGLDKVNKFTKTKNYLNEVELILYSADLCLFSMRILRNEIKVNNRSKVLTSTQNEIGKLHNILSRNDMLEHSNYTKQSTKEFFKSVGLKPKHLK